MNALPQEIVIVGGGTAGWMSACYLARTIELANNHYETKPSVPCITLIESSTISTVGVGEGSTPYLRHFFDFLGVDELTWMQSCSATYKLGISFERWTHCADSAGARQSANAEGPTPRQFSGYDNYFHPFFSALDKPTAEMYFSAVNQQRQGISADVDPGHYFTAALMADEGISPQNIAAAANMDYAYHFDAGRLGEFLKQYAIKKGVKHCVDTVAQVSIDGTNITGLSLNKGLPLRGDLFIDCSGFRGLLGKKALKRRFNSYSDTLFNDAAVAIASPPSLTPLSQLQTRSVALEHGWQWEIPLTNRTGNGYVYSSQFCSHTQAEETLRRALDRSSNITDARHLTMDVGRLDEHWQGNCLCIGLSQGFIEPLEATALMLVQYALHHFVDCWQTAGSNSFQRYNREINRMFDGIRDYIAAHYYLNTRLDTPYWQACREDISVPDTLAYLLKEWDRGASFEAALNEVDSKLVYLRPSWYCIFAGMQRFSKAAKQQPAKHNEQALRAMRASVSRVLMR